MSENGIKQFPASDLKLERLRRTGVVAFSREVMIFATVLGLAIGLLLIPQTYLGEVGGFFEQGVSTSVDESVLERKVRTKEISHKISLAANLILRGLGWLVLPVLGMAIILGAIQTRFLFTLKPLIPDLGRLFRIEGGLLQSTTGRFVDAFASLLKLVAWGTVVIVIGAYLMSAALPESSLESAELFVKSSTAKTGASNDEKTLDRIGLSFNQELAHGKGVLKNIFLSAIVFSFFMAIAGRFIETMRFSRDHRMTRAEVEAEYREMEPSAEFKRARTDAFTED